MAMTSTSSDIDQAATATDQCGISAKSRQQRDGSVAPPKPHPRLRKRSNGKHKKPSRRSSAERLHEEKLLRESIERHTRLFTLSKNPEFFVLVERNNNKDFDEEDEQYSEGAIHTVSDEDNEDTNRKS